jgi:hypothetical protein
MWFSKPFFTSIFVFLFFINAFSQNSFNGEILFGGLTSQVDGDNYGGFNKFGYHIGFQVSKSISSDLNWFLGLQWANKGSFKPSEPDKGIYNTYKINLNYAQVPIGIRYFFKKVWLEGGLSAGVLASSEEEDQNGLVIPTTLTYNPFELAYFAGVSYPLSDKFSLGIWQSRSITPIANSIELTTFGIFGGSFNNLIYFNLNYKFLKKG